MNGLKEARELLKFTARRLGGAALPVGDEPHLDDGSLGPFKALVEGRDYMEYGGGGSTIWAAKHARSVVCVETDKAYASALSRRLPDSVHHADIGFTVDWGRPAFTRATASRLRRWRAYVELPWRFMPHPHVVMVDGRFRVACVLHALSKGAETILLDDYVERPHYGVVERFADANFAGRMAILHAKASFDRRACDAAFQDHLADWR